jgi:BID domain of Bartonella effector protein (Bep)
LKTCYDGAKPDRTVRAYRDPHAAHARLTDLLKQHSWADASARVAAEPAQLGRLRGRDGIFAGRFAQLERANAILAARSVGYSLTRIAEAEQRAERGYRESVAAQSRRDAVGIPKLSAAAMAVLEAVHAVRAERSDEPWRLAPSNGRAAVAQAWETGRRNPAIAAEIDRFEAAAEQRLGAEGFRDALWCVRDGTPFSVPGTDTGQREALHQLARGLAAARWGRIDHQTQRELDALERSDRHLQRMRHRQGPSLGR